MTLLLLMAALVGCGAESKTSGSPDTRLPKTAKEKRAAAVALRVARLVQARDAVALCRAMRGRARREFRCATSPAIPAWLRNDFRPGRKITVIDTMATVDPSVIGIGLSVPLGNGQEDDIRVDVDPAGRVSNVTDYGYQ